MERMTASQPQDDLIELEIAAFMGPHIKRARIALVLIGILYLWTTYRSYGDISHAHDVLKADGAGSEIKRLVDLLYIFVIFTGAAGIANIILAGIAGTKTTFAIYTAMGIFVAHSLFQVY